MWFMTYLVVTHPSPMAPAVKELGHTVTAVHPVKQVAL